MENAKSTKRVSKAWKYKMVLGATTFSFWYSDNNKVLISISPAFIAHSKLLSQWDWEKLNAYEAIDRFGIDKCEETRVDGYSWVNRKGK